MWKSFTHFKKWDDLDTVIRTSNTKTIFKAGKSHVWQKRIKSRENNVSFEENSLHNYRNTVMIAEMKIWL